MVWSGDKRAAAAEKAGLADSSLRFALRKPRVLAYNTSELSALRLSLRARNLHRLDTIADDSRNDMARVASIKTIEQIADVADLHQRPGDTRSPGVVIVIVPPTPRSADIVPPMITLDHPPVILTS